MPTKSGSYETSGIKVSVYQVIEIRKNNFSFFSLRVATHRLRNFLLMVAMHDYYYCILTGASPLLHKDKVPAEGAAH